VKFTYDDDGKVLTVKNEADATLGYDADEQLLSVEYGSSGNGLDEVVRDAAGRVIGNDWTVGGEAITDAVSRSQSGRVVQHTTTRGSVTHTSTYGYDAAGRLVTASIPGHVLTYGFAATGGAG
jgi:YD repeat-containing protein